MDLRLIWSIKWIRYTLVDEMEWDALWCMKRIRWNWLGKYVTDYIINTALYYQRCFTSLTMQYTSLTLNYIVNAALHAQHWAISSTLDHVVNAPLKNWVDVSLNLLIVNRCLVTSSICWKSYRNRYIGVFRSSQRKCSVKKGILRIFTKFTGKYLCQSLFFNKVAGLSLFSCEFLCFPANFEKLLRTPFLHL